MPFFVFPFSNPQARILLAAAKIGGDANATRSCAFRDTALRWCDKLVTEQAPAKTAAGAPAGYWGVGYGPGPGSLGNVYFGDTGTAVTTLAMCYREVGGANTARGSKFMKAMRLYRSFVVGGCAGGLKGRGGPSPGWVLPSGAVGCGYYKGHLSTKPYVIATGTTGGAFLAELANLTGTNISTRILGRRTEPISPFLIPNCVPRGFTPRS